MKVLYGLVVATLISISAFSQTNVGGTLVSDTEWTLAGSPYTLTSTVGITSAVTLRIHAGVQVNGNFDLLIKGKVLINGTAGQPVEFNNTRLIFKSADLSQSSISYVNFKNSSGVQLADESEFNNDNPKNSSLLTVKHGSFGPGTYARTKGYQTTAKLRLEDCTLTSATVYGFYPRSEMIELENATINSSNLVSDSYNYGIHIRNSSVSQSTFSLGCCDANFDIADTEIQNSSFSHFNNYNKIKLTRVVLTNTYLNTPYAQVTISDCKFTATAIPESTLIQMANGSITNSTLDGNTGLTLVKVAQFYPADITIEKVNFKNFNVGLEISSLTSIRLKSNNFINGTAFNIRNLTNKNIDATNNYWGTTNESVIKNKIWDLYDDINFGIVDYSGFAQTPITLSPLQKPTAVLKGLANNNGIRIRWTKVNDPAIVGYKVYKKNGDEYIFIGDAGNSNTILVSAQNITSDFVVTAYTSQADGTNDQFDGYESPYSDISVPFLQLSQTNSIQGCGGKTIQVDFTSNFAFEPASSLFLLVSSSQDMTNAKKIQTKAAGSSNNFLVNLPDTLASDQTLYFQIGADELVIFSAAQAVEVKKSPAVNFTIETDCGSGAYRLLVTGVQNDINLNWSLQGGTISQESPSTFVASWTTAGEKTLTLTASRGACDVVVTKTVNVLLTNVLPVPAICSIEYDESSGNNRVSWQYTHSNLSEMKIYREAKADEFELVATVSANEQSYLDVTSEAASRAYRYRISAKDKCGNVTSASDEVMSIHLQLGQAPDGNWNLNWDQWFAPGSIDIYRQTTEPAWEKIETLSAIHTSFTDMDSPSTYTLYQVSVAGSGSCLVASNIVSNGILSTEAENISLRVHPNPAPSKITFSCLASGQYELISIAGIPALSGKVRPGENEISIASLSRGIYVLKVWSGKQQSITRVVK